jgi:hypothetical protein
LRIWLTCAVLVLAFAAAAKPRKKKPPAPPPEPPSWFNRGTTIDPPAAPSEPVESEAADEPEPAPDAAPAPAPAGPDAGAPPVPPAPDVPRVLSLDAGYEERILPTDGVDHLPPSGRVYRPLRIDEPIKVDGVLDEPAWQRAVQDTRFVSRISQPFGLPTTEPTAVQVAYDDKNLYVAYRCRYAGPGRRDDLVPYSEFWASAYAEFVSVVVDAQHDHVNATSFLITRTGYKIDVEVTENLDFDGWIWGAVAANYEWTGIWDAAVQVDRSRDTWTAEFAIPWGTLKVVPRAEAQTIGINFRRKTTTFDKGGGKNIWEASTWAPWPPLDFRSRPSLLGHLAGITDIKPGQHLYVAPFLTARFQTTSWPRSPLRDPFGLGWPVTGYGGLSLKLRPIRPLVLDLTLNPDFSQVNPDQAISVLDAFEPTFPEQRDFFAEDAQRYAFGSDVRFRLFWTRRIGLSRPTPGVAQLEEVPLLGGAKAVVRLKDHEFRLLDVATTFPDRRNFQLNDNIGVWRHQSHFRVRDIPIHVGTIALNRSTLADASAYRAYGIDLTTAWYDQHLVVAGLYARSDTSGAASGSFWGGGLRWNGDFLTVAGSFLSVDPSFDPQLGYFQQVGVRQGEFQFILRPRLFADLLRDLYARVAITRRYDFNGGLAYDQKYFGMSSILLDEGTLNLWISEQTEVLTAETPYAGGRLLIGPGGYQSLRAHTDFTSSPEGWLPQWSVGYSEGGFFGGYRRVPNLDLGVRIGPFTLRGNYEFIWVGIGDRQFFDHRVSARLVFRPVPSFQSVLVAEVNTFEQVARLQLLATWTFGQGSSLSFALSDVGNRLQDWLKPSSLSGSLRLTVGFFPF